jgi:dTDP-4-amino-4,6-dideoxygalactose transaminase
MIAYENLKTLNQPFESELKKKFDDFLNNGWYILGKEVSRFEQEFADFHNTKHTIGVANGLDALTLSLKSMNFKAGSEVIVPSNTFIATILSILNSNLTPVLVEPDINTYNIDPDKIQEVISPKTVALMVVHLYGQCCEMDKIMEIVNENNLFLIEDCAQAHGAKYKGKLAGTFGNLGAFSFYPTKNLGAFGDGGAIITESDDLSEKIKKLRNYWSEIKYHNKMIGYNSRLDELQAAFLRIKLPHLNDMNTYKRKLADIYINNLNDSFIIPNQSNDQYHVYHIFNIRHKKRDELQNYLRENGVGTEIHYPIAPHHQHALRGVFKNPKLPISEEIHQTTLSLPCSFSHTEEEIYKTVDLLNNFKN